MKISPLPNRIFLTGVPGSRWSGIAQLIEDLPELNRTDRNVGRFYEHHKLSHCGSYFGRGMEFEAKLDESYLNSAWADPAAGCKLTKSHDWACQLSEIKEAFPNDWIMLIYRPDLSSYAWWHECGGFNIKYPNYDIYKDSTNMMAEISAQNQAILKFAYKMDARWNHLTSRWIFDEFGQRVAVPSLFNDILVTIIK